MRTSLLLGFALLSVVAFTRVLADEDLGGWSAISEEPGCSLTERTGVLHGVGDADHSVLFGGSGYRLLTLLAIDHTEDEGSLKGTHVRLWFMSPSGADATRRIDSANTFGEGQWNFAFTYIEETPEADDHSSSYQLYDGLVRVIVNAADDERWVLFTQRFGCDSEVYDPFLGISEGEIES